MEAEQALRMVYYAYIYTQGHSLLEPYHKVS